MDDKQKKKQDRIERLHQLLDEVMEDFSEEIMDAEEMDKLEKVLRKRIGTCVLPYNAPSIKAVVTGYELCFESSSALGQNGAVMVLMGLKRLLKNAATEDMSKVVEAMERSKKKGGENAA